MTCSRRDFLLFAALVTGGTGLPYRARAGERAARLYAVRHRFAEELLPVARDLMGESGTATHDPGSNSILLVGPPEDIARTLRILLLQDRALQTLVVRYAAKRLSELEGAAVEIHWSVDAGGLRIGNIVPPPEGDAFAMKLHEEWRRAQLQSGSQMRLLGGSTSRIETGTAIAYPSGGRDGSTRFVTAGTGMVSSARVLGDGRVRLAIAPLLSRLGAEGRIHATSAETTLELAPGEIKVLGGIAEVASADRSSLAHERSRADRDDDRVLLVSVEIE